MRSVVLCSVLLLISTLTASSALAATLNVVGGQLMGASNVLVDGDLFDVAFLDGTCLALYDGCDTATDFTFTTEAPATLSAQALVDQVFLDGVDGMFASEPSLTFGCEAPDLCQAMIPYDTVPTITGAGSSFDAIGMLVNNRPPPTPFEITDSGGVDRNSDTGPAGFFGSQVYVVWTPIPEPGTALLLGLGLAGLAGRRKS